MNSLQTEQNREINYALRLPPELYKWVQKEAKSQLRSVNSLIVLLIQKEQKQKEHEQRELA